MTIFGGFNNFFGPIIGAFAFIGLKDQIVSQTQYWRLVLGIVLILLVVFLPGGIMGLFSGKKSTAPPQEGR